MNICCYMFHVTALWPNMAHFKVLLSESLRTGELRKPDAFVHAGSQTSRS